MSQQINAGYVKSEVTEGIAFIEFFHPQSNSLPSALLNNLAKEIEKFNGHADAGVIVLRSAGEKAFCAGASFDELAAIEDETNGLEFFSGFARVINAMRESDKLIIGRIHGKCVGGGVGLASAVDYAIASNKADIKLSELAVGIGPFVVGPAVERKLGLSAFSQLSVDAANWQSAAWAKQKGLFAEVHESVNEMDEAVMKLAKQLAASSPEAMKELKQVFWKGTEHWNTLLFERAAISGKLVLSAFTRKFIQQFKKQ